VQTSRNSSGDARMPEVAKVGVVLGWGSADIQDIARAVRLGLRLVAVVPPGDAVGQLMGERLSGTCDVVNQDDLHPGLGLAGVVTFADSQVLNTSRIADQLSLPRQHGRDTALWLSDKLRQRQQLEQLSAVRFARSDQRWQPADDVFKPVVVKPRRGSGGLGLKRANTSSQLQSIVDDLRKRGKATDYLVEDEIPGTVTHPSGHHGLADYVSVETCTAAGLTRVLSIGDKLALTAPFRETGSIYQTALPPRWRDEVGNLAVAATERLGVEWGLCHTEIKLTPTGPKVIEVNGRLGGGVAACLPRAAGLDPVVLAIVLAAGVDLQESLKLSETRDERSHVAQLLIVPPDGRHELKDVPNRAKLRGLPGVVSYSQFRRPGDVLDSALGQHSVLGEAVSVGDTYEDALKNALQVREYIERTFTFIPVPRQQNATSTKGR
jgi:biotin carboxylase